MTTRSKKIPQLPVITTLSSNDLLIVEQFVSNTTSKTTAISGLNFKKTIVGGPFANDTAAGTGGVAIGQLYYTAAGDVKVRLV